jgi:iron complex transport system substrate-binding protein
MIAIVLAAVLTATRIVSLAPNFTEDLFAIGAGPQVVGVDTYSNRPAAARALPHVGSMHSTNSETILGLHPDLIVGMTSSSLQLDQFAKLGITTKAYSVDTLADCYATIAELGRLTGHVDGANQLLARIHAHLDAVRRETATLRAPRALVIIDDQPIFVAGGGSYIDDVLHAANIVNVAGDIHTTFPQISAEVVEAEDPDVLILGMREKLPENAPPWSQLRAVRDHRIVRVDDDDLERPGPHVTDVVDELVRAVAPYRSIATPARS